MFFYSNCFWYTNTRRDCYFIYLFLLFRNIVVNDCLSDVYD